MKVTKILSYLFSLFVLLIFLGIVLFLLRDGSNILQQDKIKFLTGTEWFYQIKKFGILPMLYGSFMVSCIGILFSVPLAFGGAIFLTEYLQGSKRLIVKNIVELLSGIPSVVYGLLGVLYLGPMIYKGLYFLNLDVESGYTILTAGILVGIMILPTMLSLMDDALISVKKIERDNALTLGLTKFEMFFYTVFPKAFPGLIAAILLGIGRALGETIAIFLVIGRADNRLPEKWYSLQSIIESGQTLTSKLGGSEVFISYGNTEHWSAMMGLGLVLFVIVMLFILLGEICIFSMHKYKE